MRRQPKGWITVYRKGSRKRQAVPLFAASGRNKPKRTVASNLTLRSKAIPFEQLEIEQREYWAGMRKAIDAATTRGQDQHEARIQYAKTHAKHRDLSPLIYRTTIGHYGGLYVEVPAERFDDFKSIFPPAEFPRRVESNNLRDLNKWGGNAIGNYHAVFPQYTGITKTVFFADRSKGLKRLDFYELPHERETNPGD